MNVRIVQLFFVVVIFVGSAKISSTRSDLQYSVALTLECHVSLQMSMVDVFAVGGAAESDRWEQIARNALYLDREDFLPSGYKVSAKFKALASTPPRPRGGPRPSDRSQPSPAKKRRTSVPQHAVNLADEDDDEEDSDFYLSEEEDDDDEEVGRDEVPLNMDPADEYGSPPHRPSIHVPDSRPSLGMPSSSGTPGASSSMGRREKRKEKDPMASVLESLTMMMADSQRKHEQQMAEFSARQDRERMENLRLHKESCRIQMENSQMMQQMQQTTNMLLAAFMKINPDLLQALSAASPSPPLMIASGASRSVLGGSNTRLAEPAPLPEEEESHPIPPPLVRRRVEDSPRSPAMQPSPAEVTRPKGASVVRESPKNLEIDALEIGGGSDELGFEDTAAGSDT